MAAKEAAERPGPAAAPKHGSCKRRGKGHRRRGAKGDSGAGGSSGKGKDAGDSSGKGAGGSSGKGLTPVPDEEVQRRSSLDPVPEEGKLLDDEVPDEEAQRRSSLDPVQDEEGKLLDLMREEQADLVRAISESKQEQPEPLNGDNVTIFRLTRFSQELRAALLSSEHLRGCRDRVLHAGCELTPSFANGALLLVPVTEEQLQECNRQLQAHRILALAADRQRIVDALREIRKRKRPCISNDARASTRLFFYFPIASVFALSLKR